MAVRKLPIWVLAGAFLLAMSAGMVNSITIADASNYSASHITGVISKLIMATVEHDKTIRLKLLGIVISFFLGGVLSGYIVRGRSLYFGRRYGMVMVFEAFSLVVAWFIYDQGSSDGVFPAAFACGLQNAMFSTFSDNLVRTTHLTGLVSDFGSAIGHLLSGSKTSTSQMRLHMLIITGFCVGIAVGIFLFNIFMFNALFFVIFLLASMGLLYGFFAHRLRMSGEKSTLDQMII